MIAKIDTCQDDIKRVAKEEDGLLVATGKLKSRILHLRYLLSKFKKKQHETCEESTFKTTEEMQHLTKTLADLTSQVYQQATKEFRVEKYKLQLEQIEKVKILRNQYGDAFCYFVSISLVKISVTIYTVLSVALNNHAALE